MTAIQDYADNTKNICFYTVISIILIFVFMISPLKNFMVTNIAGKVLITLVLAYTIFMNTSLATIFMNNMNLSFIDGSWDPIKTNVVCSYAFSGFLVILLFSVLFR